MTTKKTSTTIPSSLTLAQLTDTYIKHLESEGKTLGTRFSYDAELRLAQRELGADTRIGALTRDDVHVYFNCPRVTTLKSGGAKSQLSIDKSRRVLRLALKWAQDENLIAASPAEPLATEPLAEKPTKRAKKQDVAASLPGTPDVTVVAGDEQITDGTPAPAKKPRKRKQAITLEVSQPEAELAADFAEAQITASSPESAA